MNCYCEINGQHVSEARNANKLAIDIRNHLADYSANKGEGEHSVRVEVWEQSALSYKGRHLLGQSLHIAGGLAGSKYRDFSRVAKGLAARVYA